MKKQGFTIVELLLYIGLFSILIYVIMNIFATSLDLKSRSESVSMVHQDGRFILQKFMTDINNANSIIIPNLGSSGSTLQIVLYGVLRTYQLNNNTIELIDNTDTYQLSSFGTDVTNLSFTRIGSINGKNTIKISFTLQGKANFNPGQETENFQTTIGIR